MKQKILEALKQGYKNLGLSEEAFERVAALGETFIKDEEQIATFVKGAESILKAQQSEADKIRTELNGRIRALEGEKSELEAKLNGGNGGDPEPPKNQSQDMAKAIADAVSTAVSAAVQPLQDKLLKFENEQAAKKAFASAKAAWENDEYVKRYADEASDAWERAIEVNELTGNKMTAEELTDKAKGYFNKYVSRKGVDVTKPLESEGNGEAEPNFSAFERVTADESKN